MNWGATQYIMRPVCELNKKQLSDAIFYIEFLLKNEKFKYDKTLLYNRLTDLKEQLEFRKGDICTLKKKQ